MVIQTNWCVLTGAPCSGKTTVLTALEARGYKCIPEAARVYIEKELSKRRTLKDIRADEAAFQNKIVAIKKQIESQLPPQEIIFLDRAMPDSISYYRAAGLDTAEIMKASKIFHYRNIFIFDPLPWQTDGVRNEDDETIALLDKQLEADYRQLGYEPIRIPVMSVQARLNLILPTLPRVESKTTTKQL
jgi:predicted ATPase